MKNIYSNMILLALTAMSVGSPVYASTDVKNTWSISVNATKPSTVDNMRSFIEQVWQQNPRILEAKAALNAARYQAEADSKWIYNPEIELDGEDINGAADKNKTIGISQTIDISGKFLAAKKAAAYELQAAMANYNNIRQNIAIDILSALSDYQSAKKILKLSHERVELMRKFSDLARRSFKAGDIDISEYNLAQLAYSEALIKHADIENMLSDKRLDLESKIGFSMNMDMLPELTDNLPEINTIGLQAVDDAIMQLPEIRKQKAEHLLSKAKISKARRERIPDPTISFRSGQEEGADLVGLSLSIPLNIFNSYGAEVDVAKYKSTAQQESLQDLFHRAKARFYSTKRNYELSREAWNSWKQNGNTALKKQISTLDKKFRIRDLSATEYLVQVQQMIDTQIAARELHNKAWKSWFAWLKASGNIEEWLKVNHENDTITTE